MTKKRAQLLCVGKVSCNRALRHELPAAPWQRVSEDIILYGAAVIKKLQTESLMADTYSHPAFLVIVVVLV